MAATQAPADQVLITTIHRAESRLPALIKSLSMALVSGSRWTRLGRVPELRKENCDDVN